MKSRHLLLPPCSKHFIRGYFGLIGLLSFVRTFVPPVVWSIVTMFRSAEASEQRLQQHVAALLVFLKKKVLIIFFVLLQSADI